MDEALRKQLKPGAVVTVTQQIPHRDRVWVQEVHGTIVGYDQKQTGSWFAHAKDDKLWLDRLSVRRADGELLTLNLDEFSRVVIDKPAGDGAASEAPAAGGTAAAGQ